MKQIFSAPAHTSATSSQPSGPIDLIGFDLDGTLVDSSEDIAAAVNNTLASIGRGPLSLEQVHAMVGGGSRHLVITACQATGGIDGLDMDALLAVQLEYYEQNLAVHTRPFDGVIEALDALRAMGLRIAVATNKGEKLARLLLEKLGLLNYMEFVIGGDTLGAGRAKPNPDMLLAMMKACGTQNAIFVGDTAYDLRAAKAAAIPSILMGFDADADLSHLEADHIIHHFSALPDLIKALNDGTRPQSAD